MSTFFDKQNLRGHAHWFKQQAHEEYIHAMKFYEYLSRRNAPCEVPAIDKPLSEWKDPESAFRYALEREQEVTKYTEELCALANKERDYSAAKFLEWFADEQVEEENTLDDILTQYQLLEKSPEKLFRMDTTLAQRATMNVTTPPPTDETAKVDQ